MEVDSHDRGRSRTRSPQGRSRSPSRSRSRTPSRSRYRSRSRSRSRSYSRSRSRSYSRRSYSRSASPPPKGTKVIVERLTKTINEDHLYEIFGQFGAINDLDLPLNRTYNTNRGTAYILYSSPEGAEAAITHMHESRIDNATVHVSIVLPRRKISPSPPTARRGANFDPRQPPSGPSRGGRGRHGSPGSRYGSRSSVYRPRSISPRGNGSGPRGGHYRSRSRSRSYTPPPRRGGSRSRSRSFDDVDRNYSPMKEGN